ncbi:glycosyltransferase [Kineococcus rhizosphaerae]|uniref:Cellulose synthase/poly-beta-1,6-N-acetylglucosamine synthase-like glycosyltransferase n=1 Tax=Kineococcus rhizosphaerae TaxID=559628 RepID=A0A2T0R6S2_9ACTN|nr:glycosyltransferase [Kineococcus rhizosphaerae]PRY16875.1 cellulose synthase/poly-beta-1,6-N-acetylglucosamine synthase-like glycosyltransferase [Kineococcus rhizosphaerae]
MNDPRWYLALLNTGAFLLCVSFLVYVLCILRPFVRRRDTLPGDPDEYDLHFVVPCLNEEAVITGTVRHLVTTFPRARLWCVDDASTDATPRLLAALEEEFAAVRVLTRRHPDAQQGKGPALNHAWRAIDAELPPGTDRSRVLVGILDADARLDRLCPDLISGPAMFGDPDVAAVQVQVRVTCDVDALVSTDLDDLSSVFDPATVHAPPRRDPLLIQLQDLEFTGPIAAMQVLRRRTGSVGMGGNGQFTRMAALDRIALEHGTPWHGALLEDFELGLHVLLTGGRTEYCDDTYVSQVGLTALRPLIRQRSRWAQGGMQCMRYLWRVLSSPNVPLPAALEIAYYLCVPWSQITGSVVFPLALGLDVHYAATTGGGPTAWWVAGAWGVLPLAVLFGALPHAVWGPLYRMRTRSGISHGRAVRLGVANILYGYLLQLAVWWALVRVLRGRHDWKKTAHDAGHAGTEVTTHDGAPVLVGAGDTHETHAEGREDAR